MMKYMIAVKSGLVWHRSANLSLLQDSATRYFPHLPRPITHPLRSVVDRFPTSPQKDVQAIKKCSTAFAYQ
jgi:hypothetical protein